MLTVLIIAIILLLTIGLYAYRHVASRNKKFRKVEKLEKEGKIEEATTEYEKMASETPNDRVLWKLATIYERSGKTLAAISKLKEIVKRKHFSNNLSEYQIRKKLAILQFNNNDDEEAFEQFIYLTNIANNDPDNLVHLARIAIGMKDFKHAYSISKKLTSIEPLFPEGHSLQGTSALMRRDFHRAKDCFEKAINLKQKPDKKKNNVLLATACYYTKDYKKSMDILTPMTDNGLDLNFTEIVYKLLGLNSSAMNESDKAYKYFDRGQSLIKEKDEREIDTLNSFQYDKIMNYLNSDKKKEALQEIEMLIENDSKELYKGKQLRAILKHGGNPTVTEDEENLDLDNMKEKWYTEALNFDTLFRISAFKRLTAPFDVEKYIEGSIFDTKEESIDPKSLTLCSQFGNLDIDTFIRKSRQIIKKLDFDIIEENIHSKDVLFSAGGEGIDYIAIPKGDKPNRFVIQVRRWESKTVGELVMKNLLDQMNIKNAKFGLFITTSQLSEEAINFVEQTNVINIIQGKQLEFLLNGIL